MNVFSLLNHDESNTDEPQPRTAQILHLLNPTTRSSLLGKHLPAPGSPATPAKRQRVHQQIVDISKTPLRLPSTSNLLWTCDETPATLSMCSSDDLNNHDDVASICTELDSPLSPGLLPSHPSPYRSTQPPPPARRLAQSRIVGHRYRANERRRTTSLADDVLFLQLENEELLRQVNLLKAADSSQELHTVDLTLSHRLSNDSARILDIDGISGATALMLLSTVAARRNLFNPPAAQLQAVLECPSVDVIADTMHNGILIVQTEAMRAELCFGMNRLVWQSMIWNKVARLHANWARFEVVTFTWDDRRQFEKRCTRCGKVRTAGSGHPRSECDDGRKVGSLIPYQEAYRFN